MNLTDAREVAREAETLVRRLIPFPGSDSLAPLLPLATRASGAESNAVPASVQEVLAQPGQQAASLVSQAASILDEEMAKGVLAARRSSDPSPYGALDAGTPLLRQAHELVDRIAALWSATPNPTAADTEGLADLRPPTMVRPGQRATISMRVCNSESRPVRLMPAATDLLGSAGGRIAGTLLEFTPADFTLESQQEQDLTIAAVVPAGAAPGCYSGLLVVRGIEYLRALITIEVAGSD
jgi:hypothetical protein